MRAEEAEKKFSQGTREEWRGDLTKLLHLAHSSALPGFVLVHGYEADEIGGFARLLAQGILCRASSVNDGPCGKCIACAECTYGTSGDLLSLGWEEELAPTLKLEDAQKIQQHLLLQSFDGGGRVVVVREATRFNIQAVNRLLKTLEEPPAKTWTVMTTTRLRELPETLKGRALLWTLRPRARRLSPEDLIGVDGRDALAKLVNRAVPLAERLVIAESYAKVWKDQIDEILTATELILNGRLRLALGLEMGEIMPSGNGASRPMIGAELRNFRAIVSATRDLACLQKIPLNTQMMLEALALGRIPALSGDM